MTSLHSLVQRSPFGRFLSVGAVNTLIDLALYSVLAFAGLPILIANFCSTLAGLCFSFIANRRFTFRVADRARFRDVVVFFAVTGAGLWLVQPVLLELVGRAIAGLTLSPLLQIVVPKVLAISVGIVWNWTWYSRLLFRDRGVELPLAVAAPVVSDPVL